MAENKNPLDDLFKDLDGSVADLFSSLRAAFETPEEGETPEEEPAENADLTSDALATEAIRLLQKAEDADSLYVGEQLIAIADRYIRLTELSLIHG